MLGLRAAKHQSFGGLLMRNVFLLAFLVLLSASAGAQTSGNQLFDSHCARCHGIGGTGGEGPSLTRLVLRHAGDDEALSSVIVNGIPNSDMPGNWMLGTNDVKAVAKYVRSLGRAEEEPLPGDADKGRRLYEGKGACNICHIVAGEGGVIGPDLSNIGIVRGLAHLREALVAPGANVALNYVVVTARTKDGEELKGHRVNEDSFTVQLRDESGRYHSLDKLALASFEKKIGESLMPSYEGELTPEELDDLVSYLSSMRGEP